MASLNRVTLIGNVGSDPERKNTTSGTEVLNFTMATNERYKKDGEYQEQTEWHKVVAWGKLATTVGAFLEKGATVYVDGKIQTRSWEDKDGNKKYMTEVVASSIQVFNRTSKTEGAGSSAQGRAQGDSGQTMSF